MNLVNDKRGVIGQRRAHGARGQTQESALLAGQERVACVDEPGKGRVFRQEPDGPLERRHVVVFPDRHMLVEVADQRFPPADQPPAGLTKER